METYHKQVRVRANGQDAYVDEGIAPLIREMWRAGIRTLMSCQQGAFGLVWLYFDCPFYATKFMNIVAEYEEEPDSLYQRMLGHHAEVANTWEYDLLPEDFNLTEEHVKSTASFVERHDGDPAFEFHVSIRFPPTDLPLVLDRLVRKRKAVTKNRTR
jgi:hypothetical protein